jgi:predicted transcriptional regulator
MQVLAHIEGEQNRMRILQYMVGRQVTNGELQKVTSMTKQQIDHHLRRLEVTGHIAKEKINGAKFAYKRTNKKYVPKDFTKELEKLDPVTGKMVKAQKLNILEEDMLDIKPTVPHARVVRLLKHPLDKAPKKRSSSMYGGIQSGMAMFGEL